MSLANRRKRLKRIFLPRQQCKLGDSTWGRGRSTLRQINYWLMFRWRRDGGHGDGVLLAVPVARRSFPTCPLCSPLG